MAPLQQLFALEIEYHRKLRCEAPGTQDATALHTSYALQAGYERLLGCVGRVTAQDIERMSERHALAGDARDVLAARDSLIRLLGLWPYES
jgi:hypothetical protein